MRRDVWDLTRVMLLINNSIAIVEFWLVGSIYQRAWLYHISITRDVFAVKTYSIVTDQSSTFFLVNLFT